MDQKKTCVKCEEDKPLNEFGKRAINPDGLQKQCRACHNKQAAIYHANNRETRLEQQKAYRKRHEAVDKKRRRGYYQMNRDSLLASQRVKQAENREAFYTYYKEWRDRNRDKVNARCLQRIRDIKKATPGWANVEAIEKLRELARFKTLETGIDWNVDHIVPIKSKYVCGLHCEDNMRVITAKENMEKHNKHWPDMPEINYEQWLFYENIYQEIR